MSEDHRTKRIVVRFTEDDLAWLNEQAEDEGVEPATLVRMIVARLRKGRAPLVSMMSAAPTAPRMVQRADIADLFEDDGRTLKSLKALPREISDAIESIEWVEDGTDESGKTRYRPKVKLFDKNAANFTLLKHFGGLPDPTPPAPKTNNILNVSASTISKFSSALSKLSEEGRRQLAEAIRSNVATVEPYRKLFTYYPDHGPLRRELYPRHLAFFAAGGAHEPIPDWCPEDCDGSPHRERLALCANRVGKTEGMGGYEMALHLTGRYPAWWVGHRIEGPIEAWAAGKTNESTRNIIQKKLFGPVTWRGRTKHVAGTGLIPAEDIGEITWKRGIQDFIDTAGIRNRFGGWSEIGLKSYEQGRGAFEGTEKDLGWCDEEPPLPIYTEMRMRLMTRRGHALLTFTPLEGMSEVVQAFLPGGRLPGEAEF